MVCTRGQENNKTRYSSSRPSPIRPAVLRKRMSETETEAQLKPFLDLATSRDAASVLRVLLIGHYPGDQKPPQPLIDWLLRKAAARGAVECLRYLGANGHLDDQTVVRRLSEHVLEEGATGRTTTFTGLEELLLRWWEAPETSLAAALLPVLRHLIQRTRRVQVPGIEAIDHFDGLLERLLQLEGDIVGKHLENIVRIALLLLRHGTADRERRNSALRATFHALMNCRALEDANTRDMRLLFADLLDGAAAAAEVSLVTSEVFSRNTCRALAEVLFRRNAHLAADITPESALVAAVHHCFWEEATYLLRRRRPTPGLLLRVADVLANVRLEEEEGMTLEMQLEFLHILLLHMHLQNLSILDQPCPPFPTLDLPWAIDIVIYHDHWATLVTEEPFLLEWYLRCGRTGRLDDNASRLISAVGGHPHVLRPQLLAIHEELDKGGLQVVCGLPACLAGLVLSFLSAIGGGGTE